jgi:hypothetical protein
MLRKLIRAGSTHHPDFIMMSSLWMLIILLTLLQDYFSSKWGGIFFDFHESLAYKIFWLLFIPFYLVFKKSNQWVQDLHIIVDHKKWRIASLIILPVIIGLTHLVLFACLLYVISPLFNNEYWNLALLIKEKLTTRLYIVIAVYLVFAYIEYRRKKAKNLIRDTEYSKYLSVKNGSKATRIDVFKIKWIQAAGGYVEVYTDNKKHVLVDSLKHILTVLNPEQFKRIHKSTIVNIGMIDSLKSRYNGDYDVMLKDGKKLRLSRNYAKPFKGILL